MSRIHPSQRPRGYVSGRLYPLSKDPDYEGPRLTAFDLEGQELSGLPIYCEHDYKAPVGKILSHWVDSENWLNVEGQVYENTPYASRVMELIRSGDLTSFSIGYWTPVTASARRSKGCKKIIEASVTDDPLYPGCDILVKCSKDSSQEQHILQVIPFCSDSRQLSEPAVQQMSDPAAPTPVQPPVAAQTPASAPQQNDAPQNPSAPTAAPTSSLYNTDPAVLGQTFENAPPDQKTRAFVQAIQDSKRHEENASKLAQRLEALEKQQELKSQAKEQKELQKLKPIIDESYNILKKTDLYKDVDESQARKGIEEAFKAHKPIAALITNALGHNAKLTQENQAHLTTIAELKRAFAEVSKGAPQAVPQQAAPSAFEYGDLTNILVQASKAENTKLFDRVFTRDEPPAKRAAPEAGTSGRPREYMAPSAREVAQDALPRLGGHNFLLDSFGSF